MYLFTYSTFRFLLCVNRYEDISFRDCCFFSDINQLPTRLFACFAQEKKQKEMKNNNSNNFFLESMTQLLKLIHSPGEQFDGATTKLHPKTIPLIPPLHGLISKWLCLSVLWQEQAWLVMQFSTGLICFIYSPSVSFSNHKKALLKIKEKILWGWYTFEKSREHLNQSLVRLTLVWFTSESFKLFPHKIIGILKK